MQSQTQGTHWSALNKHTRQSGKGVWEDTDNKYTRAGKTKRYIRVGPVIKEGKHWEVKLTRIHEEDGTYKKGLGNVYRCLKTNQFITLNMFYENI